MAGRFAASIADVAQRIDDPGRLPKSARTRARLVDAAVELCLSRGYEHTTVERISAAAGVSPRTFARHFGSKEEVLLTLVDDLASAISDELATMDPRVPALRALCDAHATVFRRVRRGGVPGVTAGTFGATMMVLNSSPELRVPAAMRRPGFGEAITARSGAGPGEREHELTAAVFGAISAAACGDSDPSRLTPELVADRYEEAFQQFTELVDGLSAPQGQPRPGPRRGTPAAIDRPDSDPPQARPRLND